MLRVIAGHEYRALLDAIRLRDPREASRLMREHLAQLELQFTPSMCQI